MTNEIILHIKNDHIFTILKDKIKEGFLQMVANLWMWDIDVPIEVGSFDDTIRKVPIERVLYHNDWSEKGYPKSLRKKKEIAKQFNGYAQEIQSIFTQLGILLTNEESDQLFGHSKEID